MRKSKMCAHYRFQAVATIVPPAWRKSSNVGIVLARLVPIVIAVFRLLFVYIPGASQVGQNISYASRYHDYLPGTSSAF